MYWEAVSTASLMFHDFPSGILVGTEEGRAMVEDAEGKGYIVEKGVYVGRNLGKVKAVLKDRVIIEERFKDYMGKVKTKEIVLQLHTPGEEEQP